jgi:transcription elongation factor Elf1
MCLFSTACLRPDEAGDVQGMTDLKNCPFCGHIPISPTCFVFGAGRLLGRVECTNCRSCSPEVRTDYRPGFDWTDKAAEEWNRRA